MTQATTVHQDPIDRVLDLARWAPSGDNTQPWRFEKRDARSARIQVTDTRRHCVYDLDGHPTEIAAGAFIETACIAAAALGFGLNVEVIDGAQADHFVIDVVLSDGQPIVDQALFDAITTRAVCRFALSSRALDPADLSALAGSLGAGYRLLVNQSRSDRFSLARLNFVSAHLRLTIKEAWEVHRSVIEWGVQFSDDRIPDQALGADAVTVRFMRWAIARWERVSFLNRYLFGTVMPRIQLDLIPGMMCGAHLGIVAEKAPSSRLDYIAAGRAMQRLWLTAESRQILLQPEMTPLIFARYARESLKFSEAPHAQAEARAVQDRVVETFGASDAANLVFLCRVGYGRKPAARSLRKSMRDLMPES